MWYRVFGANDARIEPAEVLEHLRSLGVDATGHFRGDDQGWFAAELVIAGERTPLALERFLSTEEGIRSELNAWAAWLETCADSPNHSRLMQHMVSTTQIFTLPKPVGQEPGNRLDNLRVTLCQFLAQRTAGVYQIDDQGFFAADGALLLQEKEA